MDRRIFYMEVLKILYLTMGGFYLSKRIPKRVIRMCICFHIFYFSVLISGIVYFLKTNADKPIHLEELFTISVAVLNSLHAYVIVESLSLYFSDDIERVLKDIEGFQDLQNKSLGSNSSPCPIEPNPKNLHDHGEVIALRLNPLISVVFFVTCISVSVAYFAIAPVHFSFTCKENERPQIKNYLIPTPFYDWVTNLVFFWAVCTFQVIIVLPMAILAISLATFFLLACILLNNIVVDHCRELNHFSREWSQQMEHVMMNINVDGKEEKMTFLLNNFERKLNSFVEIYYTFWRITEKMKPFMSLASTLITIGLYSTQFFNVYIILGTDADLLFKFKHSLGCFLAALYMYGIFYTGRIFDDLGEAVRYEVYNMPWYYLPPRKKKTY